SEPAETRRTRRSWLPWLILILVLVAGAYWLANRDAGSDTRGANPFGGRAMPGMTVPVRVATAQMAAIEHTLKAIGTVTAFNTVTVRSKVDGELQKLAFEDGQRVKEGDLLAQIDP